jgi:hypothetical protein
MSSRQWLVASNSTDTQREELAALALLASGVVVATRRVLTGLKFDDIDQGILDRATQYLKAEADALRFVESSGQHGQAPSHLASSGAATQMLLERARLSDTESLDRLVGQLLQLSKTADRKMAKHLFNVFSNLTDVAIAAGGSSGDSITGSDAVSG